MVAEQLTELIQQLSGTRLPPERSLASRFGVSRAEVRKCLAALEIEGRLERHVGRGTFLRRQDPGGLAELSELARDTSPRDAMQARLLIEPELAGIAAVYATAKQIDAMRDLTARMRAATTWRDYERDDGHLHRLIAECSGNKLLTALHGIVDEVRRAVIWSRLDSESAGPASDYSSFAEHDLIVGAIDARDRSAASAAMRRHLRTTKARLIGSPDGYAGGADAVLVLDA